MHAQSNLLFNASDSLEMKIGVHSSEVKIIDLETQFRVVQAN